MKDIWEFKDIGKRNLICYTEESIRHPAKMELNMCREIIKRYSKKGDFILDPMAGIGTTIVEGMILGRNVIGIEYEQKFVDMVKKNITKTAKSLKFMTSLGKGWIIKGDSRKLSDLLNKQADSILMSPPFGQVGKADHPSSVAVKGHYNDKKLGQRCYSNATSTSEIENLEYGKIDSIITSPPYCHDSTHRKNQDNWNSVKARKMSKYHIGHDKEIHYSNDKKNIGNKTGKTYLSEMLKIYKECFKVLKKEGFMILVLKNFVRKGKQVRLDLDSIKLIESVGFKYLRRHYRKIKNPSFWITNAIQKWEKKNPNKQHPYPLEEDILVFIKEPL